MFGNHHREVRRAGHDNNNTYTTIPNMREMMARLLHGVTSSFWIFFFHNNTIIHNTTTRHLY